MAFPLQFLLKTLLPHFLMAKNKKKHSTKDKISEDILGAVAQSLKKFRKVTRQIGKLSTGQKLVGGLALAAAGLTYLARQQSGNEATTSNAPLLLHAGTTHSPTKEDDASPTEEIPSRRNRKSPKSK